MSMNTKQTARLYEQHAEDFRTLLGDDPDPCVMGMSYGVAICRNKAGWHCRTQFINGRLDNTQIPTPLAVAAMTESWRQRLKEKHAYTLACTIGGQWCTFDENHNPKKVWDSLPEAICAAVKALADEKRAKAKEPPHFGRIIVERFEKAEAARDDRIRQTIREELRTILKGKTVPEVIASIDHATGPYRTGVHYERNFLLGAINRAASTIWKNNRDNNGSIIPDIANTIREEMGLPE